MPIYEYVCGNCGHQFEWLVREDEKLACPSCGGQQLNKQISVPSTPRIASAASSCPAREMGACGVSKCCGGGCGLNS